MYKSQAQETFRRNFMNRALAKGGLTHYQTTNFRPFRTERVCRRQFQI